MNKRMKQIALLCLVGFLIGTVSAWNDVKKQAAPETAVSKIEPAAGVSTVASAVGGSFALVDHNGKPVTDRDYADSYKLVFFGFTHCPDVCPTELQKMTNVLKALGKEGDKIQPLFITVDPGRDTPDVMKTYVENFHPRLVGLTGTDEQVKAAEKAFKVYAAKVEDPMLSDYTMNHSSYMFLMSPANELISLYTSGDSAADMVKDIMQTL